MSLMARALRTIVQNDAMRNDPDEIYNWRVLAIVCSACFGGMLFGWETGAIGGVLAMEETQKRFGYADASPGHKATQDQNIVSTLQGGCFLACFFTSWFAEKFGRRWCLISTGLLTIVGVIFQAGSTAEGYIAVMYVGRFIAGLGVGAASTLVPLYVSECAPRAIRGGLISFYQLFIVTGVMLAFWTNYGCLLHIETSAVYIVPLALQALPALLLVIGMLFSPESPRWCARQDDWERTTSILVSLRRLPAGSDCIQNEVQEISDQLETERRLTGDATAITLAKEMFLIPDNRKRTIISVIGIYGRVEPPVEGEPISPFGYFAITCIYLWAAFFQFGWGPCCWILVSEIPTARLRAMNVAISAATQWLFNFIIARTVLTMQQTMGQAGYGMFFMFGSYCILMGCFVWIFVPETKGLSLEKMDELFGVSKPAKEADAEAEVQQADSIRNAGANL